MNIYETFAPGRVLSFEVYPSQIYGRMEGVVSEGIVTYDMTRRLAHDVVAQHIQVYPTLPDGVANDATSYLYVMVRKGNDRPVPIGIPWIRMETVQQIQQTTYHVTIQGDAPGQEQLIKEVLNGNGFMSVNIQTSH